MSGEVIPLVAGIIAGCAFFILYVIKTERFFRRFSRNTISTLNWVGVFISMLVGYYIWSFLFSKIN